MLILLYFEPDFRQFVLSQQKYRDMIKKSVPERKKYWHCVYSSNDELHGLCNSEKQSMQKKERKICLSNSYSITKETLEDSERKSISVFSGNLEWCSARPC